MKCNTYLEGGEIVELMKIESSEQFKSITRKDNVVIKWRDGSHFAKDGKPIKVYSGCFRNKLGDLILDVRRNIYFNFGMFKQGLSNVEEIYVIKNN